MTVMHPIVARNDFTGLSVGTNPRLQALQRWIRRRRTKNSFAQLDHIRPYLIVIAEFDGLADLVEHHPVSLQTGILHHSIFERSMPQAFMRKSFHDWEDYHQSKIQTLAIFREYTRRGR